MKEGGKEHEKFFFGQLISETHSLANAKGEKMLWFDDTWMIFVEKSFRTELFGLIPMFGIHVDGMEKGNDVSVFGNGETFEFNISAM